MLSGAFFVVVGGIGVLRMPTLYTRMHASSLTDTMATLALFSGMMIQTGLTLATVKLFAIMVFLLLTGPTATYALANAAHTAGFGRKVDSADVDELLDDISASSGSASSGSKGNRSEGHGFEGEGFEGKGFDGKGSAENPAVDPL